MYSFLAQTQYQVLETTKIAAPCQSLTKGVSFVSGCKATYKHRSKYQQEQQMLRQIILKCNITKIMGAGIACWLERQTLTRSDIRSKGCEFESRQENFLLESTLTSLCADSLFGVRSTRPRSFCQKWTWQLMPILAFTHDPMKLEWADYTAIQA